MCPLPLLSSLEAELNQKLTEKNPMHNYCRSYNKGSKVVFSVGCIIVYSIRD